jgi:hypothetical protein
MDCMDTFGPDNFSTLQRCIKVRPRVSAGVATGFRAWRNATTLHMQDETSTPTQKLAMSVIRMSHYDSDVFFKFKQVRTCWPRRARRAPRGDGWSVYRV